MIRRLLRNALSLVFGAAPAGPALLAPITVPLENAATIRDRENLATIREMLEDDRYHFRSLETLMRAIGTTDARYARDLLKEVGAREEYRNDRLFGLKSRVGERATSRRHADDASRNGDVEDEDDYEGDADDDLGSDE